MTNEYMPNLEIMHQPFCMQLTLVEVVISAYMRTALPQPNKTKGLLY